MARNSRECSEEQQIDRLLQTYPRTRPSLTPEYERSFVGHYRANRSSAGLNGLVARLEAWMHKRVANEARPGSAILEVGAGTLNHIPYERKDGIYDVVEPFRALWEDSPYREAVRQIYADIGEVPDVMRYDRVLSIAALEHLTSLPIVVARCATLMANGGLFQVGIPTEGGALWGTAWRLTTGIAYRLKYRMSYAPMMRHEHVNDAAEIEAVLAYLFSNVQVSRFPLPGRHFSFYTYIVASAPRLDRCNFLLQNACTNS